MWMQRPQPIPGVPIGLEYLSMIEKLLIQQKVDLLEGFFSLNFNMFDNMCPLKKS